MREQRDLLAVCEPAADALGETFEQLDELLVTLGAGAPCLHAQRSAARLSKPAAAAPLVNDVFETAVILGEDAGVSVSLPLVEDAVVTEVASALVANLLDLS